MSSIDEIYERIGDNSVESVCYKKSDSGVAQFFAGRTLFITGVTGFLGKCLLEKLLRSCPKIKHIYVLMRESKKESLEERTKNFFQHPIFDRLREECSDFQNRVTALKGDLEKEDLGLSADDRNTIIENVNVMYHNAANVQFLEKVRVSLRVNVLGTKRMLDLAEECKHLDIFVYISTAYSHCYMKDIDEKFYPFETDFNVIHEAIEGDEKAENGLSEEALKLLIGRHPNIYTYTKAFSEDMVRQRAQTANFALVVFRPSIVIATFKEPLAGWWDNTLGPVLIFLSGPMGVAHVGYHHNYPLCFIPCDLTVNAAFVITRDAHNQWEKGQRQALVYNYGSSTVNPANLNTARTHFDQVPYSERPCKALWYNFVVFTSQYWLFWILHILWHFLPACLGDLALILMGKKPRLVSLFFKVTKYLDLMDYFGNGNWRIYMPKTLEVIDRMSPADRELFYCDIRTMTWEEFSIYSWRGLKKYILKEPVSSEAARRRHVMLWYAHYGLITTMILGLCYYMYNKVMTMIF